MDAARQDNVIAWEDVAARAVERRAELASGEGLTPAATRSVERVQGELEVVLENIEYGIYAMGPDLKTRYINSAFQKMWGVPQAFVDRGTDFFETIEYLREKGMYDVPDEEWPDYVRTRYDAVCAADGIQRESRRLDGRVLLYTCQKLPDGGRMLVYFDITDRKETERQLEASTRELEKRIHELELLRHELRAQRDAAVQQAREIEENRELLAEAIENTEEAIVVWGEDGRLLACNRRIRDIYPGLADVFRVGVSFEEMIREGARRGVYVLPDGGEDALVANWQERLSGEQGVNEHELADGRWIRVNSRRTPHGKRVATIADVSDEKESEANILELASKDPLTGLANRRAFDDTLAELEARFRDAKTAPAVGLLFVDLDHFKEVNDTHGHGAGDEVLKAVAGRLQGSIRKSDLAARIGGDEFAIILQNAPERQSLVRMASRLIRQMADPIRAQEGDLACTVSIGGAHCIADACQVGDLTDLADKALYAAKDAGRDTARMHFDLD